MNKRETVEEKIFILGFNKVGTASFHHLFKDNGINSRHHGSNNTTRNLAFNIHRNWNADLPILHGIDEYTAYSDMNYSSESIYIEGNRYYKSFFEEYPSSYYILNTRNVDKWIESRKRHGGGTFLKRYSHAYNLDESSVCELWRQQFIKHDLEVTNFFNTKEANFLRFNIETDSPEKIKEFLERDFKIDIGYWGNKNPTTAVAV